jgi:magnesium transporter
MIKVTAWSKEGQWIRGDSLEVLKEGSVEWYWVDFIQPTPEEAILLDSEFHFHPLAIEDCLHWLQRPKVDFYDDYHFFVVHALDQLTLEPLEVNLFIGENYVVSFHERERLMEIDAVVKILEEGVNPAWTHGNQYVAYLIMDNIVDGYYPSVFALEDHLLEFDDLNRQKNKQSDIQLLYAVRGDLLKIRRTVHGMGDMFYRVLHTDHTKDFLENQWYFDNIYDHLLKLSESVDANREMTADIRDSLISLQSDRMNRVMTLLTAITTIFIPITFVAGVYGMNFRFMPETQHPYGYFAVLGIMLAMGIFMYHWFKKKGFFDF